MFIECQEFNELDNKTRMWACVCVFVFAWMDMDITREPDFQLSKAKYKSNIKIRNIL